MGYTSTTTTIHEVTCDRCGTVTQSANEFDVAKNWYRVWAMQYQTSLPKDAYDLCYACYSSAMTWFDDLATDDDLPDDDGLADWERDLLAATSPEVLPVYVTPEDLWRLANWYEAQMHSDHGVSREDNALIARIRAAILNMEG